MTERPRSVSRPQVKRHEAVVQPPRPQPHPGKEAILWTPWKLWVTQTRVEATWDIVLTQSVLATILEQELQAEEADVGGVLWGELLRCPTSGRRWVRADSVWRSAVYLPEACDAPALASALGPATTDSQAGSLVRVGWYHSHARLGVSLTESESRYHELDFPKPWQFAVILVARSDPAGGVYRRGPAGVLSRRAYAPFYELSETVRSDGSRQTMIHWQNYTTDSRVHLIDPASLRDLASPRPPASEVAGIPSRTGGPGTRPRRARDGLSRPSPADPARTPRDDSPETSRRGSRRPPWARLATTAVGAAAVFLAGWYGWERFGRGEQPGIEFSASGAAASAPGGSDAPALEVDFLRAITILEDALNAYASVEGPPTVSCDALATVLSRAERAFRSTAAAYAALSLASPGGGRTEYESAALRMGEASRHFVSSGCDAA
jgi:hypothetical protein